MPHNVRRYVHVAEALGWHGFLPTCAGFGDFSGSRNHREVQKP